MRPLTQLRPGRPTRALIATAAALGLTVPALTSVAPVPAYDYDSDYQPEYEYAANELPEDLYHEYYHSESGPSHGSGNDFGYVGGSTSGPVTVTGNGNGNGVSTGNGASSLRHSSGDEYVAVESMPVVITGFRADSADATFVPGANGFTVDVFSSATDVVDGAVFDVYIDGDDMICTGQVPGVAIEPGEAALPVNVSCAVDATYPAASGYSATIEVSRDGYLLGDSVTIPVAPAAQADPVVTWSAPTPAHFFAEGDQIAYSATVANPGPWDIELSQCAAASGECTVPAGGEAVVDFAHEVTAVDVSAGAVDLEGPVQWALAGSDWNDVWGSGTAGLATATAQADAPKGFWSLDKPVKVAVDVDVPAGIAADEVTVSDAKYGVAGVTLTEGADAAWSGHYEVDPQLMGDDGKLSSAPTVAVTTAGASAPIEVAANTWTSAFYGIPEAAPETRPTAPQVPSPWLKVTLEQTSDFYTKSGEEIGYIATLENITDTSGAPVRISLEKVSDKYGKDYVLGKPQQTLDPGDTAEFTFNAVKIGTAPFTVGTQILNEAIVQFKVDGYSEPKSSESEVLYAEYAPVAEGSVKMTMRSAQAVVKEAGGVVDYTVIATNTTDALLKVNEFCDAKGVFGECGRLAKTGARAGVAPAEALAQLRAPVGTTIAPGETVRFTGQYMVTATDVLNGTISNNVMAQLSPVAFADSKYNFNSAYNIVKTGDQGQGQGININQNANPNMQQSQGQSQTESQGQGQGQGQGQDQGQGQGQGQGQDEGQGQGQGQGLGEGQQGRAARGGIGKTGLESSLVAASAAFLLVGGAMVTRTRKP